MVKPCDFKICWRTVPTLVTCWGDRFTSFSTGCVMGERLKHTFLIGVLAFSLTACSHNPPGVFLTQAQVTTILGDASAGMNLGCAEEWLPQNVCDICNRILADAQAAANGAANGGWAAAAKAVLVLEESRLPPDSRLRPYFDAAIPLL